MVPRVNTKMHSCLRSLVYGYRARRTRCRPGTFQVGDRHGPRATDPPSQTRQDLASSSVVFEQACVLATPRVAGRRHENQTNGSEYTFVNAANRTHHILLFRMGLDKARKDERHVTNGPVTDVYCTSRCETGERLAREQALDHVLQSIGVCVFDPDVWIII